MNEKVLNHLKAYCIENGWSPDIRTIEDVLIESEPLWEGNRDCHRHWDLYTKVIEVNGMIIGFESAQSTGDMSVRDLGYEFNYDSIQEYVPIEQSFIVYKQKANKL